MLNLSRAALLAPLLAIACGGSGAARSEAEAPSPRPVAVRAPAAAVSPVAPPSPAQSASERRAEPPASPESDTSPCATAERCWARAERLQASGDDAGLRDALQRGCSFDDGSACFRFASMAGPGKGGPKDEHAAASAAERACKADVAEGCALFGICARDGVGTPRDEDAARAAFHKACMGGYAKGCRAEHELTAAAAPKPADDVEGANLTMGGVQADGVRLKNIACKTKGSALGGLFGGITVVAGFKSRKARLDACSPKEIAETRVKWTSAGGRMMKIHAVGASGARNACVEKALAGALSTVEGVCAATLLHGRKR